MTSRRLAGVIVPLLACLVPTNAAAQRLDLSLTPLTITFPSSDPDVVPIIDSGPVTVTYRIRQYDGPWTITVLAAGDLISGLSAVDISNVTWIGTPAPPFRNGTLSKTVAQPLATGVGATNPARTGQVIFRLANSWSYAAGVYAQTVTFTLSAP